jgi:hypothetical protein
MKEEGPLSRKRRCELYRGPMTEGGERFVSVRWTVRKGVSAHRKQGSGRTWKNVKRTPQRVEMKEVRRKEE